METIKAKFKARNLDLEMFAISGIKHETSKEIRNNIMEVTWTHEVKNRDEALEKTMSSINMLEVNSWNVKLISLS